VFLAGHDREKRLKGKMLTMQRSELLRGGEGCNPPGTHLLPPVVPRASISEPAERSVSFNRDVHVKRIGESRQYHTIHTATYPAYVVERERSKEMALLDFSGPRCIGYVLEKAIYIYI